MDPIHVIHIGKVVGENERLDVRRGRMYPNRDYQVFKETVAWEIRAAMGYCPPWPFPWEGPVGIRIHAVLPRGRDVDNILKPILDAAELAGVVVTDNQFRRFCMEGDKVCRRGEEPRVEFWIEPVQGGDHGYTDPYQAGEPGGAVRGDQS